MERMQKEFKEEIENIKNKVPESGELRKKERKKERTNVEK